MILYLNILRTVFLVFVLILLGYIADILDQILEKL